MSPAKNCPAGRRRRLFGKFGAAFLLAACLLAASCASKAQKRRSTLEDSFDKGDYSAVIDNIKAKKKLYGETNAFLYHMDLGVLYHYAGHYDSSGMHLQKATEIYDELFTKSVTNEAAALLTNDNVRPYRSKPYELATLHQIAALNFMAQGRFDDAMVETRKMQILFNEWERTLAKSGKYHTDGMFHLFSSLAYERIDEPDNSMISLYKAVDAYKKGPVALPEEVEGFAFDRFTAGDREDDISRLGISARKGDNRWTAKSGETEIVIVGFAGKGPNMEENNWWGTYDRDGDLYITTKHRFSGRPTTFRLPAPRLPEGKGGYTEPVKIKISLPELRVFPSRTSYFSAQLDGAQEDFLSVVVNDYNLQAQKALDDAWSDIIIRTVIRAVIRTIAAEKLKAENSSGGNQGGGLLNLATDIATNQMEKADIRMCFLLPQSIQIIRFPVEPGTHNVTVSVHGFNGNVIGKKRFDNVTLKRGEKKVLLHNSPW